jgi:hypothetical protein
MFPGTKTFRTVIVVVSMALINLVALTLLTQMQGSVPHHGHGHGHGHGQGHGVFILATHPKGK